MTRYQLWCDDSHHPEIGEWGVGFRPSADDREYSSLDAALDAAAAYTAAAVFNTYSVQPVPGSGPRYEVQCGPMNWGRSSFSEKAAGYTWQQACDVFATATRSSVENGAGKLVYRIVEV